MGRMIEILPQIRAKQVIPIINPKDELRQILYDDMGSDITDLYDSVIRELEEKDDYNGDDYESIADGYHNLLVDYMNELQEIVMQKRLDRKKLENLYEKMNREL